LRLWLFALLLAGVCGCRRQASVAEPKAVSAPVQEFIREGAILRALTAQGVDMKAFGDQMGRVQGAFDLAYPEARLAPKDFDKAVGDWGVALKLVRMERKHKTFLGAGIDPEFVRLLRAERGEPVLEDWYHLEIHPYVVTYLAEASDCFERGRREVEQ